MSSAGIWAIVLAVLLLPILYTYILYPLILETLHRFKKHRSGRKHDIYLPKVFIVMAIHNEEQVLAAKMESIAALQYDGEWEVWVGSDASTDHSATILQEFAARYAWLKVSLFDSRVGKAGVLNELVSQIKSVSNYESLLLFTDADILLPPDLIQKIVPHFSDKKTGLVDTCIIPANHHSSSEHESRYWAWENRLKWLEGELWGCAMGASGGCFALRLSLYKPIPYNFIVDDFFLSINVLRSGRKAVLDPSICCFSLTESSPAEEVRRKRRIASGNWQNYAHFRLFFLKNIRTTGFCFYSHKWLRWLTPLLMLEVYLALVAGLFVLPKAVLIPVAIILSLSLATPLLALVLSKVNLHVRWLDGIYYFYIMQYALAAGAIDYFKGIETNVWKPTKRRAGV